MLTTSFTLVVLLLGMVTQLTNATSASPIPEKDTEVTTELRVLSSEGDAEAKTVTETTSASLVEPGVSTSSSAKKQLQRHHQQHLEKQQQQVRSSFRAAAMSKLEPNMLIHDDKRKCCKIKKAELSLKDKKTEVKDHVCRQNEGSKVPGIHGFKCKVKTYPSKEGKGHEGKWPNADMKLKIEEMETLSDGDCKDSTPMCKEGKHYENMLGGAHRATTSLLFLLVPLAVAVFEK